MYFESQVFWKVIRISFSPQYFHPLHSLYVTLFSLGFLNLKFLVTLGRWLDRIFYPEYSQQSITAPIYITGNPRSGTTFLHRLLCYDSQFTYTKLYHTIFPSISFYYLLEWLGKLNSRLNGIFTPIFKALEKGSFRGWDKIHNTKLNQAEEDEQFFVFTMLSPVITLLFPFFWQLTESCWVDKLPQPTRQKLMSYYYDCLQRHLYAVGDSKTLLIKNTTCTGRLESTLEAIPDLKIIHLIRHPYEAIPSLLSMYQASWNTFVPQTWDNHEASKALAELYANYYRQRLNIFEQLSLKQPHRLLEVRYEDLVANPLEVIKQIYTHFQLPLTPEALANFQQQTQQSQKNYRSKHKYSLEQFGLTPEIIYNSMPEVFEKYGFQA